MSGAPPSAVYTHEFVRRWLPEGARDLLEIGCGSGEVAALLAHDGFELVAIDSNAEAVAQAQATGVNARQLSWPAHLGRRFDAVLFTRSLHHIDDLPGAVEAARAALAPRGRILVEDFRAEGGSGRSARWFEALARELHASGALSPEATVEALLDKAAPSSSHDHHLHSSADIRRALNRLDIVFDADAAYYFRYLEPHLVSADVVEQLIRRELDLIAKGTIDPLGQRFVVEDR